MLKLLPGLFLATWLGIARSQQEDLHYIGVGYNMLTGNPDGSLVTNGGVDPGLLYTRKILEVTGHDSPMRVQIEHRHSCAQQNTTSMYFGTKSYQDKLKMNFKSSGGGNFGLASFSFTLSARYQEAHNQTNVERNVIQDQQSVCNLGRVRYMSELARAQKFPITPSFAATVCSLPVTYNQSEYMDFLDHWGTHVTTEVELGVKRISRSRTSLTKFMNQVMHSGGFGMEVGGSYAGFSASVGMDFDKFKQSDTFRQNYGSHQYTLQSGSDSLPEPISLKLETIDLALDPIYWQRYDELVASGICASDDQQHLQTRKSNLERALTEYAAYKMAPTPSDPDLKIPLVWPKGTYGLMMTIYGCPSHESFTWHQGYVIQDTEDRHNKNAWTTPSHVYGVKDDKRIQTGFCIKGVTQVSNYDMDWPKGDYCILKYGNQCPDGFHRGSIYWDDEDPGDRNHRSGTLPDGYFGTNTEVEYCCRADALPYEAIALPNERPFILLRHRRGCQVVHDMDVREEIIQWDTEDDDNNNHMSGDHPYEDGTGHIRLHFCVYTKKDTMSFSSVVG
ncbi:uncharacterized protein [Magallana gigas]|uniref:uncharacterized protein isoform X2 n=1 Tax=Magallana gigas TaxID=29159 RepID=UPI003341E1BF